MLFLHSLILITAGMIVSAGPVNRQDRGLSLFGDICSIALGLFQKVDPTQLAQATTYCSSYIRPTLTTASVTTLTSVIPGKTVTTGTFTSLSTATFKAQAVQTSTTTYSTTLLSSTMTVHNPVSVTTSTYTPTVISTATTTGTSYATISVTSISTVSQTSTQYVADSSTATVTSTSIVTQGTYVTNNPTITPTSVSSVTTTVIQTLTSQLTTTITQSDSTTFVRRSMETGRLLHPRGPAPSPAVWNALLDLEKSAACSCVLKSKLPTASTIYTTTKTSSVVTTGPSILVQATTTSVVSTTLSSTSTSVISVLATSVATSTVTIFDSTSTSVETASPAVTSFTTVAAQTASTQTSTATSVTTTTVISISTTSSTVTSLATSTSFTTAGTISGSSTQTASMTTVISTMTASSTTISYLPVQTIYVPEQCSLVPVYGIQDFTDAHWSFQRTQPGISAGAQPNSQLTFSWYNHNGGVGTLTQSAGQGQPPICTGQKWQFTYSYLCTVSYLLHSFHLHADSPNGYALLDQENVYCGDNSLNEWHLMSLTTDPVPPGSSYMDFQLLTFIPGYGDGSVSFKDFSFTLLV